MIRSRFFIDVEDYRPVKWPIKYPYWCTGISDDGWIIVAYTDTEEEIYELWPEAENVDFNKEDKIIFNDRFPKPDWYDNSN